MRFFLVLVIAFSASPLLALQPVLLDEKLDSIEFGKSIEYIEGDTSLTLKDAIKPGLEWKKSPSESFNFGFTTSVYWFRFAIHNKQREKGLYLEISYPMIDFIELYIPERDGSFHVKKAGDRYPFYQREIIDRNFIFLLHPGNKVQTYYMRVETSSSLNFKPTLWSQASYIRRVNTELPLFWIYYGLMIVMVVYNLFLYFSIRELRYLYYSMFISSFILFQMTLNGLSFQYLWPNWIWLANNILPFLMCFTCFSAGVFVRSYLNSPKNFPRMNRVLLFFSIIPCLVWAVASLVFSYRISIMGASFMALYSAIIMYGSGAVGFYYKSRAGRYIVIGFTLLVFGVALFVLKTFGVLPANALTQWSIQIGSSLIVVLLSLGLADEINVMKNELQSLNIELVDLNENLEHKVEQRTEELQTAMEELQATNDALVEAKDALWGEMQLAKKIQTVLLPKKPVMEGYEIAVYMAPADEVGGDYYDIINVKGIDWIIIGDVSGHGVPAGLIMMMVQTSIHSVLDVRSNLKPSVLLTRVNSVISDNIRRLGEDKYMTITVMACVKNGKFHFSGLHQDIMIFRAETSSVELVETKGMWLGIFDNVREMMEDDIFSLHPGDTMLVFTDGITEAWHRESVRDQRDPETEMFGIIRLKGIMERMGKGHPEAIKAAILEELEDYNPHDDVTMVLLKRV